MYVGKEMYVDRSSVHLEYVVVLDEEIIGTERVKELKWRQNRLIC